MNLRASIFLGATACVSPTAQSTGPYGSLPDLGDIGVPTGVDTEDSPAADTVDPAFLGWCRETLGELKFRAGQWETDWTPLVSGGALPLNLHQPGPAGVTVTMLEYPHPEGVAPQDYPWEMQLTVVDGAGRTLGQYPPEPFALALDALTAIGLLVADPDHVPEGHEPLGRVCDERFTVQFTLSHPTVPECRATYAWTDLVPTPKGLFEDGPCPVHIVPTGQGAPGPGLDTDTGRP